MDHSASREQVVGFDLESGAGVIRSSEEGIPDQTLNEKLKETIYLKLCDRFPSVDDCSVKLHVNLNVKEDYRENNVERHKVGNPVGQEKRKMAPSAKKPPRPPKGFSLDAYDQKLIKEIAELAMIKRARIERMKTLKQKRASKISSSSSSSSSSHGTLFAMTFTIFFFLVILLQG